MGEGKGRRLDQGFGLLLINIKQPVEEGEDGHTHAHHDVHSFCLFSLLLLHLLHLVRSQVIHVLKLLSTSCQDHISLYGVVFRLVV